MKWKNLEPKVEVLGSVSLKLKVTVAPSVFASLFDSPCDTAADLGDDAVEDVVDSSSLLIK
jgi:hypothetical protein